MTSETGAVSEHQVEALARTYGTTVEEVREVIARTGTRSLRRIEEALEQQGADRPTARTDAQMRLKALARWEGEGGAVGPGLSPSDALDDSEVRILARIGAAALTQWGALADPLRETMLGSICSPLAPGDGARLKARIAAFLRENANR